MHLDGLKVGTLSFELDNWNPVLSHNERRKIIRDVSKSNAPDLLLCAGFSVDQFRDIQWLTKEGVSSFCYVEVTEGGKNNGNRYFLIRPDSNHSMPFEPQVFATRYQCTDSKIQELEDCEDRFHKSVRGLSAYLIVCGELNIIEGRNEPKFLSSKIEKLIQKSDIVLNPNHDRMGNPGTLDKKRHLLSSPQNQKNRLYVNCANWNTNKINGKIRNQRRDTDTLHTVYLNGKRLNSCRKSVNDEYEYRETIVTS